jgi:hypothetical protein
MKAQVRDLKPANPAPPPRHTCGACASPDSTPSDPSMIRVAKELNGYLGRLWEHQDSIQGKLFGPFPSQTQGVAFTAVTALEPCLAELLSEACKSAADLVGMASGIDNRIDS